MNTTARKTEVNHASRQKQYITSNPMSSLKKEPYANNVNDSS